MWEQPLVVYIQVCTNQDPRGALGPQWEKLNLYIGINRVTSFKKLSQKLKQEREDNIKLKIMLEKHLKVF